MKTCTRRQEVLTVRYEAYRRLDQMTCYKHCDASRRGCVPVLHIYYAALQGALLFGNDYYSDVTTKQ